MSDQPSIFDKPGRVRPAPSQGTADRGVGAGALRTAREVVQQDAVKHGTSDPDSFWAERHRILNPRARQEHLAMGHNGELFEFTPGTQLSPPRALDPFKAFADVWDRARTKALEGFGGLDERRVQLFLAAHSVRESFTDAGDRTLTVDVAGWRFASTGGETRLDSLDALARRVMKGSALAEGPTPKEPRAPSALELAAARRSPDEQALYDAHAYFLSRKLLFTKSRDRGLEFSLMESDVDRAARIGVPRPASLTAPADVVAFFQAIDAKTAGVERERWEGLTKEDFGAEGNARTNARVGALEGLRTDRYIDDGAARATAAHAALPAGTRPGVAASD